MNPFKGSICKISNTRLLLYITICVTKSEKKTKNLVRFKD